MISNALECIDSYTYISTYVDKIQFFPNTILKQYENEKNFKNLLIVFRTNSFFYKIFFPNSSKNTQRTYIHAYVRTYVLLITKISLRITL